MDTNTVITNWKRGTTEFECINPNGVSTILGTSVEGEEKIASPKAIMLGSLAVCSGLDVVAILKKMRVELDDFKINTTASLTDEHPRFYNGVTVEYHFFGQDLDKEKTLKILDQILKGETPKPGSYRGRINNEPENNRKTLMDYKNA